MAKSDAATPARLRVLRFIAASLRSLGGAIYTITLSFRRPERARGSEGF